MDDDGSKSLIFEEFAKGVRETGLDCTDDECRIMFEQFDKDGSGTVNIDEFLMAIRVGIDFFQKMRYLIFTFVNVATNV